MSANDPIGRGEVAPPIVGSPPGPLTRAKDALLIFLPKPVQEVVAKGLLKTLLVLVFIVVILPVLIAYLAAFWVKHLGSLDNRYAVTLRKEILTMVNEGFTVEEVANEVTSRNNTRLDYLQVINANLSTDGKRSDSIKLMLQDYQRVNIDIQNVVVTTRGGCSLRENSISAVVVDFEGVEVKTLHDNYEKSFRINQKIWDEVVQSAAEKDSPKTLMLRLADPVKATECGEVDVHVSGAVLVFKSIDLLPVESKGRERET